MLKREFKQALASASRSKHGIFLELFSGEGGVSKQLRKLGYGVMSFEILLGGQYDVTRKCVVDLILGWISSGCILGIWFGTPCSSCSSAALARFRTRSRRDPLAAHSTEPGIVTGDLGPENGAARLVLLPGGRRVVDRESGGISLMGTAVYAGRSTLTNVTTMRVSSWEGSFSFSRNRLPCLRLAISWTPWGVSAVVITSIAGLGAESTTKERGLCSQQWLPSTPLA